MDLEWLKSQMNKLRAEASRGAVPSATVFNLTDPIMDSIARNEPINWRDDPDAIVEDDEPMIGRDYA